MKCAALSRSPVARSINSGVDHRDDADEDGGARPRPSLGERDRPTRERGRRILAVAWHRDLRKASAADGKHTAVTEQLVLMIEGKDVAGEAVLVPAGARIVPKETRRPSRRRRVTEQRTGEADTVDRKIVVERLARQGG